MSGLVGTSSSKSKVLGKSIDTAKAWCRYNGGSGSGVVNGSFNVSSLSDGGNGIHTINFTESMPTTAYSAVAVSSQSMTLLGTTNTTGVLIETRNSSNVPVDTDKISVVVFDKPA